MIRTRIQIGNGAISDTYDAYGLIYLEADDRFGAPLKKFDSTSYAEQAGENIDARSVPDAFDYKVTFVISAPNYDMRNANAVITKFNEALYSERGGVRTYSQVTFYNDYKRVKIVGIPQPIAEAKDFYRRADGSALDCVTVEFTLRVSDPTLCDFNMSETAK